MRLVARYTIALLVVAAAICGGMARADESCVQQCADQWAADKAACLQTLNTDLARIDAQVAQCITSCGYDVICQGMCGRTGSIQRAAANNRYRACVNTANTRAWNCYRGCNVSEATP